MKKRMGTRRQSRRQKLRGIFGDKPTRKPRSWMFEHLEVRNYFTASPLTGLEGFQWYTVSNSTPEGQQLIDAIQQAWAAPAASTTGSSSAPDMTLRAAPSDPYFGFQWHLFNVGQVVNPGQFQDLFGVPGQDINVIPAWDQGYTGAGVLVAVVDSGVELDHPDLLANLALEYGYDALQGRPGGQAFGDEPHGTAVAGLIGAVANNGQGGTGVAFGSRIVPIRLISGTGGGALNFSDAVIRAIGANGAPIDIYNHSWGPVDTIRAVRGPSREELIALSNSARLGRNGLGQIHVWASGNGAGFLDSAGSDGYINSRYTIGVGMVDHDGAIPNSDGTSTQYGEMAPSVLIVAPSASGPTDIINDFDTGSGIFTTDLTGDLGYNISPLPSGLDLDIDTFPDPDYTTRFGGTSAATPIVSGVIALMLEANPNLSYRDVQEILVRSARQNTDLDESWITNLVPLFRDPIPHARFPTNYPIDPMMPVYPNDEDFWNDEIVYRLVPGTVNNPSVQATTGPVAYTNSELTVTAIADGPWDGWVANNLTVEFLAEQGDIPFVTAAIINRDPIGGGFFAPLSPLGGIIRVTVTDDLGNPSITWMDIKEAMDMALVDFFTDMPMFDVMVSDPDGLFDPTADVLIPAPLTGGLDETGREMEIERARQYETYHPIADPMTTREPLSLFTNGAGYTVSHGRGGNSEYGWAHGVVNAALAVDLARQWHLKGQNLPPEKTYLVGGRGGFAIRAAQVTNEESGEYVIPGGVTNSDVGFAEYFNEFFVVPTITAGEDGDPAAMPPVPATDDSIDPDSLPFTGDDPPVNARGRIPLTFNVPAIDPVSGENNLMTLEWVEVQVNITGDPDAFNYLRIALVSPDGTHSELTQNQYRPENIQHNFQSMATGGVLTGLGDSITAIDESGSNTNRLNWVYSTNRFWGERSDSKTIYDDMGLPVDFKGWELHFENYSASNLFLHSATVGFHGSPIGSATQTVERVTGKVGVDSGRFIPTLAQIVGANDREFNFDRYITTTAFDSHAPTTSNFFGFSETPFGEHEIRIADATQEPFAGNITVYAIDNATGQRAAEFITGYDGNYYFDLPNNDVQATTGPINARNSVLTVTAVRDGLFAADAGNGITISFVIDPTVENAVAQFDGANIEVRVRDESVTWGNIESAIEAVAGGNQLTAEVSNRQGTFTATDQGLGGTLAGGQVGSYTIRIEDPLGRSALADGRNYDNEWVFTIDTSDVLEREAGEVDPMTGEIIRYFNNLNFLLDPGSIPPGEVVFTGQVIADLDGDAIADVEDIGVANFRVFADLNHTRQFELGEPFVLTDLDGNYELHVATGTPNTFTIAVEPPAGWTVTVPASGLYHEYALPGDLVEDLDFAFKPPSSPSQVGNGSIFGFVFNDLNGDGIRQFGEDGLPNFTIFLDANSDGEFDPNTEVRAITSDTGAYTFISVQPGTVRVDALVAEPFLLTFPKIGYHTVTLVAGQVVTGVTFGVQNLATHDMGDLIGEGFRTHAPDGPRHFVVPGFSLGETVDAEIRSRLLVESSPGSGVYVLDPALNGIGDDQQVSVASFDDEDGVFLMRGALRPGANPVSITVNGVGGYLQGWVDFNGDKQFGAGERVFTDVDLNPGTYQLIINAPSQLPEGQVAARFRWGTGGIDFFGADIVGEVEDYLFDTGPALGPGDYNGDMLVNDSDYQLWRTTFGSTTDLRADGNNNGAVDAADFVIWRRNQTPGAAGASTVATTTSTASAAAALPLATTEVAAVATVQTPADAAYKQFLALRKQLSLDALKARNEAAAAKTAAWAQSVGAEAVIVNSVNGPTTRYIHRARSTGEPVGGPQMISPKAIAADTADATTAPEFLAATFSTTVSQATPSAAIRSASVAASDSVDSALLLLTAAQTGPADDAAEDDFDFDSLVEVGGDDDETQLALAAVFDEETDWLAVL